jgi:hypothetical protein
MNAFESQNLPAYPQIGVASTCRSYREYMDMFSLNEADLRGGPVLDVAGGASSFTAELHGMGLDATAADPFYEGDREAVIAAAAEELSVSSLKVEALRDVFDWSYYGTPERHRTMREKALARFAADFREDIGGSRYVAAALPELPFADGAFRTVLCSHFLFLYGDRFDERFHQEALDEMLRVTASGGEIRIYPLVTLKWDISPIIQNIMEYVRDRAEPFLVPGKLPFIPVASEVLLLRKR